MSELTEATKKEAAKLHVPITRSERARHYAYTSQIKETIAFLEEFKDKPNAYMIVTGSDDYQEPEIIIEWQVELSEEEVSKAIRRRINDLNIQKKAAERAKLTKEKRLKIEIQELEKKLARKKKALEK